MIISKAKGEYIQPRLEVVDVACEAGFQNSTGGLTINNGACDGWYSINY